MSRIDDDPDGAATAVSARHHSEAGSPSFVIQVIDGADFGTSVSLDETTASPLFVGQSATCALRLRDHEVSRRHLSLELARERLRITDLGSTNGTFIGGVAIVEALLAGGEQVRVGGTTLQVARGAPRKNAAVPEGTHFGRVLGVSAAMRRLYPLMTRLALSNVPVILEGETGTGKELVAETLHAASARANEAFVVFDCAAEASASREADLFGQAAGMQAGARAGVFEQAHRGTLMFDEVGELDVPLQGKLLRALDRGEIRRAGGSEVVRVDVRVLATTRRNLDEEVQAGRFREDLFYRLAVSRLELPPLRKRGGDVRLLARQFFQALGGDPGMADETLLAQWERAAWPGNVRQLRNAVADRIATGAVDDRAASPPAPTQDFLQAVIASGQRLPVARLQVVKEFERRYIAAVLAQHGGNVARAAEASGIARRYFQILRGGTRR